jgi:hypothetical protein
MINGRLPVIVTGIASALPTAVRMSRILPIADGRNGPREAIFWL